MSTSTYTGAMVAVTGFLFTYYNSRATEERRARISRVNEQLKNFYGPLLAAVTTTKAAYDAMVAHHSPDGTPEGFIHSVRQHPEGEVARAYRLWMVSVLQPLNETAAKTITSHVDLLDSWRLEPALLALVAHVTSTRVMLQKWAAGDEKAWSLISYPEDLGEWVGEEFGRVKLRQAQLLGIPAPQRPPPTPSARKAAKVGAEAAAEADAPVAAMLPPKRAWLQLTLGLLLCLAHAVLISGRFF